MSIPNASVQFGISHRYFDYGSLAAMISVLAFVWIKENRIGSCHTIGLRACVGEIPSLRPDEGS
jgi:hypothetical protein